MPAPQLPAIPPHRFYYLHNFQQALDWLGQRYGDLLSEEEAGFLAQFAQLPQPSQALLVRMVMRKGPWFRAGKLVYEEIGDSVQAAAPLLEVGWISRDAPMALPELFALHTKPELLQILKAAGLSSSLKKAEMLAALTEQSDQTNLLQPYAQWHPEASEPVWRVMVGDLCERLRLMFFGNLYQDWSEFVLADLGIFRYEAVALDAASRAFQSRADVDFYLAISASRQALEEGADVAQLLQSLINNESATPWLDQRRAKVLLRLGQSCERAQNWPLAEQAYTACRYPGARHRLIRVLEQMQCFDRALVLANHVQAAPESEEERQRVARMLPRLQRGLGQASTGRRAALAPAVAALRMDVELPWPAQLMSVEYALRDAWQQADAPVFYVENALINSLFGLLCWPAIFAPLPGAFFHPFQSGPADLSAPDFVARRQTLFDACLAELNDGRYRATIRQRFVDKAGMQSPFVFWGTLSEELLTLALDCIPAAHLQLFFARLLRDVKGHRTGFPDLVRFWLHRSEHQGRYELVEVKAPGDKLQDNQIRWLSYCTEQGLPVRVCHVHWLEAEAECPPA
ncbi:VRR-NUC domain-containing protein [Comamonas testosteroni]|uniref:phosphodiesterase I n=1 Tax=Comamonas testosteroni TaxID=285 RepID=A0A373FUA6_COMTE|nr:VRR-NUC domain-containing protein [Comamonas testosteroni]RGE47122.1 VRR-NUC domain-containing protein [Comamonas testosteroni]